MSAAERARAATRVDQGAAPATDDCQPQRALGSRLAAIRAATAALCAPLQIEDYVLQSMPDASPAKWHLAHTTWFFETFVLGPHVPGYHAYRSGWDFLFNSYYEAVGPRHPRAERGMLSRPTVAEIYAYRTAVDEQLSALLAQATPLPRSLLALIELGLQHEQQHQELLLTDIQHALWCNPLRPSLHPPLRLSAGTLGGSNDRAAQRASGAGSVAVPAPGAQIPGDFWIGNAGGLGSLGCPPAGPSSGADLEFAFDNETPAHRVYLRPFALAKRSVSAGQFAEFIADGGYRRPELWLSEGWSTVRSEGWQAPLYWEQRAGAWWRFSLYGMVEVDPRAPVCHVSFFEADAFACWAGLRLPSEAEWECAATELPRDGQFVEDGAFVPLEWPQQRGLLGGVWTWTSSAYAQYPGYLRPEGAIGEYNAKFMVNQMVLRGGSCFSPAEHVRATYRNFFPPSARWQVSGIRLARDL